MDSSRVKLVHEYRGEIRGYVWAAVIVGIILVFVGLFFGLWFAVVGSLFIIVGAIRAWTLDLIPDQVIAARMEDRERATRMIYERLEQPNTPSSKPLPPPR